MNQKTFTVKIFMIIASAFMVICYFLPMISINMASYGSYYGIGSIGISAMNMTFGMQGYGFGAGTGMGICFLMLLLPCILTVLWIFRADGIIAVISLALSVAIAVMYVFFAAILGLALSAAGASSSGLVSITAALVIGIIVSLFMVVLSFMLAINKIGIETEFKNIMSNVGSTGRVAGRPAGTTNYRNYAASSAQQGAGGQICPKCGAVVSSNAQFCPGCGSTITRKTFCTGCGTELAPGAAFCTVCGKKQQ